MAGEHKHPNYMAIFWLLAVLTVIELIVVFLPFGKVVNGTMLCALAVGKAAVVAMYFMHLKFDSPVFMRLFTVGITLALGVYCIMLAAFQFGT